jgi:pullulanase
VRSAILGRSHDDEEPSFESTVRKMIDCRLLGFRDGAEAVNYVGSHDVEGFRNERLFNYLDNNGIAFKEERIKLAFACLLTAVGIPMIFAGDEFADEHDLAVTHPPKQRDAVNYERVDEPFRRRVFDYVSRLVKFRTASDALSVNDTEFIHVDFHDGKRVVAWRRGRPGSTTPWSSWRTSRTSARPNAAAQASRVPRPQLAGHARPAGDGARSRRAAGRACRVGGREPIFPWEAKVYTLGSD